MPNVRSRALFPGFWRTVRHAFATRVADRSSYVFSLVLEVAFFFLLLHFYTNAYAMSGAAGGLTLQQVIWSLVLGRLVNALGGQGIAWRMADDVYTGQVELFLMRPLGYLPITFARYLGNLGSTFLSYFVLLPFIAFLFVGFPLADNWSPVVFPWLIVLFFGGFLVRVGMFYAIGLLAFWIENSGSVIRIFRHLAGLFSGAVVPLQFFPLFFQSTLLSSPFGASSAATLVFQDNFLSLAPRYFFIQLFWMVFFFVLTLILWQRARKRLFVNGG
jgi:ABC-2 type transport system permease protein